LVCSHITLSVEFEKPFSTPQCLQVPVLSRPFGASMIQWWTQFFDALRVAPEVRGWDWAVVRLIALLSFAHGGGPVCQVGV